jgi:hypothetical protein
VSRATHMIRAVPALGEGHAVQRPRAHVREGPKPRYTIPQTL